ncbi:MAG: uracil-DNA glycosylase [Patescibacteria group bacterium]|nr:uracil-DNA glycosylase [Patescibacteria group bacterium]
METLEEIESAKNLEKIAELVKRCKRCRLHETKIKDVPGDGNPKAEIMFIGEAPGRDEDLQGKPFVGAAGKFLTEMIESISLKRSEVFIGNVVKHRPPNNRDPLEDEIEACFPYLNRQIELIKPKLIVLLGKHAMERFLPDFRISQIHGQPKRKAGQVYLPLYHPAAALYNGSMREVLQKDFKKIPKILELINNEFTNK